MRSLAFARALLTRWNRRAVRTEPLGVVFLRSRPALRAARAGAGLTATHVHLRPRISLVLVRHAAVRSSAITPAAGAAPSGGLPSGELVLRTTATMAAERLVERLLARGRRLETAPRVAPAAGLLPAPAPSPLAAARSELVVRRSAPAAPPGPVGDRPDAAPWAAGRPGEGPAQPSAPIPAAALDVGRLTDQVLAAIDGRLVAQIERNGSS